MIFLKIKKKPKNQYRFEFDNINTGTITTVENSNILKHFANCTFQICTTLGINLNNNPSYNENYNEIYEWKQSYELLKKVKT